VKQTDYDRREQTDHFTDPANTNSRRSDGVGVPDAVKLAHR